jgi:hypothetical protein
MVRIAVPRLGPLFIAFLLLAIESAQGQVKPAKLEFFGEGGLSLVTSQAVIPLSERTPVISPIPSTSRGYTTLIGFRYYVSPKDAIEAAYSYRYNKADVLLQGNVPSYSTLLVSNISASYVRYVRRSGRLLPFATAGLGIVSSLSSFVPTRSYTFGGNLGVGADLRISDRLALRFEVRDFIARMPQPLPRTVHTLTPTAGLLLALHSPAPDNGHNKFSRFEFFAEGGASFLTGNAIVFAHTTVSPPGGQPHDVAFLNRSSFSKTGRLFVGLRVRLRRYDAMEAAYSYAPNRYVWTYFTDPAVVTIPPLTKAQSVLAFAVNYVRYFPEHGRYQPFVTAGMGDLRYAGISQDIDRICGNFGGGMDARINRWISFRIELRDFIAGQPDPITGLTHNVAPTAGLVFKFN